MDKREETGAPAYTPPMGIPCGEGKHEQCVGIVYRIPGGWCSCSCECHEPKKRAKPKK